MTGVMPSIDVIVPVHGNWLITRNCLLSLREQTIAHHVILVDDKSPDDTVERVVSEFPEVEVIAFPRNRGFAAACNAGIAAGTGAVLVLCNNDVQAEPQMLELLAAAFERPEIGSATGLILQPDGLVDAFGITADSTLAGFVRLHGQPQSAVSGTLDRLLGPYGAVAAYRRVALEDVGLLDENIFMYGEELDLALRLSAGGWRPAAVAAARSVHLGSATAGRGSASQRERSGFGRAYLMRAWRVHRGAHAFRALAVEILVCVGDAIMNRDFAALRGRRAGWRAGRHIRRPRIVPDLEPSIGVVRSIRLRLRS